MCEKINYVCQLWIEHPAFVPHYWTVYITVRFSHNRSEQFWHGSVNFTTHPSLHCTVYVLLLGFFCFVFLLFWWGFLASDHRLLIIIIIIIIIILSLLKHLIMRILCQKSITYLLFITSKYEKHILFFIFEAVTLMYNNMFHNMIVLIILENV